MKSYYIIIIGILCLTIGAGLGYSIQKDAIEEEKNNLKEVGDNISTLLVAEESTLLDHILARFGGNVSEIDNKSLLIKKGENSFEAKIGDLPLAVIKTVYDPEEGEKLVGEDFELKDVKIGDQVYITCILKAGLWQLKTIVIEENFPEF
jgi:hypothetical protein